MSGRRWSLLDLVTLATLGIASGVLFAGWGILWSSLSPLFAAVLPLQYLLFAGTWVIAGPLAGLIIRRPGAALAGEMIAASVSFLLASQWSIGLDHSPTWSCTCRRDDRCLRIVLACESVVD